MVLVVHGVAWLRRAGRAERERRLLLRVGRLQSCFCFFRAVVFFFFLLTGIVVDMAGGSVELCFLGWRSSGHKPPTSVTERGARDA